MNLNNNFDDLFYQASEKYGVPFAWIKAIAGAESDWNPRAYRAEPQINDGSRGLMQVLYKTAYALGFRGNPDDLFDPATSIEFGTKLLAENIGRFGEDFAAVYSAYNSGSPTAYKTNTDVASHVARAQRYLDAVNSYTVEVTAEDPGSTGAIEIGGGIAIAIAMGIGAFFLMKGH